jgi:phosphatidylinositol glycan class T
MHNRDMTPTKVLWMETIPWFITLYLHAMTVVWAGSSGSELVIHTRAARMYLALPKDGSVRIVNYKASDNLRRSPTLIETFVELPPRTSVLITVTIEKASILYTEHPPDANRGWDIPAAVFTLSTGMRIYTTTLLAELPTPDFSMPYNVIIMTCTLVALFFGSIFNILTRSFVWVPN